MSWIKTQRPLVDDAIAAYDRAITLATTDFERGTAFLETAQIAAWFSDAVVFAGSSSMPGEFRANPKKAEAYIDLLRERAGAGYDLARAAILRCVELRGLDAASPVRRQCSELGEALPQKGRKPDPPDPPAAAADGSVAVPSRPYVATSRPGTCSYRGSLRIKASAFATEFSGAAVAALDGFDEVEVDELVVPQSFGKRAKLRLAWPLSATLWLDAEAVPFVVVNRMNVVGGFVFLEPGHAVQAAAPVGETVELRADFRRTFRQVEPPQFRTRFQCSELELGGRYIKPPPIAGVWTKTRESVLSLFDRPDGSKVARFEVHGTNVVERRQGWVKVAGRGPFGYEGWMRASDVGSEPEPGYETIFALTSTYTHGVTKPIPVRTRPDTTLAPFGMLANDAPVRLGKTIGDHVEVFSASGILGPPAASGDATPWYARTSDIAASTEPAAKRSSSR